MRRCARRTFALSFRSYTSRHIRLNIKMKFGRSSASLTVSRKPFACPKSSSAIEVLMKRPVRFGDRVRKLNLVCCVQWRPYLLYVTLKCARACRASAPNAQAIERLCLRLPMASGMARWRSVFSDVIPHRHKNTGAEPPALDRPLLRGGCPFYTTREHRLGA